jgi:hypothetical protein
MKYLEDELRNALRHKEAPSGFAERVASRIFVHGPKQQRGWRKYASFFRFRKIAWCAVAVVTCLAVFLGIDQYRSYQRRRAEGELAKSQLMLALKIAGKKLSLAQRKVLEIHNRGASTQRSNDQ